MQIPTFMHGSENNNSHSEGLQLGPDNKEFSCLFQIYIKDGEMLIATSTMLRALFFVVLHVTGIHSYVIGKGGYANFFFYFANCKSANSWAHPQSQIRKFLKYARPQIANPQIATFPESQQI
jgi:hypothetical protein